LNFKNIVLGASHLCALSLGGLDMGGVTALAGGFRASTCDFFALVVCSRPSVLFSRFSDAVMHHNTTNPHKQLYNED
jgi:hypothetical protein